MIDLLALLATPTTPAVPLEGSAPSTDGPMSATDLSDFASVLAALVTPTPLVPTTVTSPSTAATPPTPSTPQSTPMTPLALVTPPAPSMTPLAPATPQPVPDADGPVGRIIAFIPVPRQPAATPPTEVAAAVDAPAEPLVAPEAQDPRAADTHVLLRLAHAPSDVPASPVAQEVAAPVDGVPAVQHHHIVHITRVPEREGAPAPVDVPEPAPTELAHPATLGVLGPDWGDRDAQSRVDLPVPQAHSHQFDAPAAAPAEASLQLLQPASAPKLQRTPESGLTDAEATTNLAGAVDAVDTAEAPVVEAPPNDLPVAHTIPDAVDIPATKTDGADPLFASSTAAPHAQAATHASAASNAIGTRTDDDPRPLRSVAAPLRHAVREASTRRDGEHTITIRLDPPELGTVRIRVEAHGEKVSVTLHTELAEAKSELQTKHRDIADILRNEGFTLDGFDVDTSDHRPQRDDADKQPRRGNANAANQAFDLDPDQADDGELRL